MAGQLDSSYSHMEKQGSRYLRYALFNATKFVCMWDNTFAAYPARKRSEGNIIMLLYPMPPRNWYGFFTRWKKRGNPINGRHKF